MNSLLSILQFNSVPRTRSPSQAVLKKQTVEIKDFSVVCMPYRHTFLKLSDIYMQNVATNTIFIFRQWLHSHVKLTRDPSRVGRAADRR